MRQLVIFFCFLAAAQLNAKTKVIIKAPCIWNDVLKNKQLWLKIVNNLEINQPSWDVETVGMLEKFQNSTSCSSDNQGFDEYHFIFSIKVFRNEKLIIILNQPKQNERVFIDNENINISDERLVENRIYGMINNIVQVVNCNFDQNNDCMFHILDTTSLLKRIKTYKQSKDCKKLEDMYNYFKNTQSSFTQIIGNLLSDCQQTIEEEKIRDMKRKDYQNGVELMKKQDFQSALLLFRRIGDYEQSFEYITKCKLELFGVDSLLSENEFLFWWNSLSSEWKNEFRKNSTCSQSKDDLDLVRCLLNKATPLMFTGNTGLTNLEGLRYFPKKTVRLCWMNLKDFSAINNRINLYIPERIWEAHKVISNLQPNKICKQ